MSLPLTVEGKPQAKNEVAMQHKCRIPQRLPPGRQRQPLKPRSNIDKNKTEIISMHKRQLNKNITYRPRSSEKQYPVVHKKIINDKINDASNKTPRQIITVPVKQKVVLTKTSHQRSNMLDQETIKKHEDLELQQEDSSDAGQLYNNSKNLFLDLNEEESITSRSGKVAFLKNNWQEKNKQFQEMKDELYKRQKTIVKLYASLRHIKESLRALGQSVGMPGSEDLRIMNVDHMTPAQLLQLCSRTPYPPGDNKISTQPLEIDINKLNEIPSKLVAICEQTLVKRKEFIDWFQHFLNNSEKEYSKQKLIKKINEFNEENKMVNSTLQHSKNKFIKDTNDHLRIYLNETVRLRLQNEELTLKVSELISQNKDLKKLIFNYEQQKLCTNKIRIEELEKELKEENVKKITMKDKLSRAEGQIQIGEELSAHLEKVLMQSQKTIQQLHEKNELQQIHFDKELNLLKESMERNTSQLEEIVTAREALQSEKEDLKKKLEELSKVYNESINNLEQDLNKNIAKLIEVEKKYNDEVGVKIILENTIESQCADNEELEIRYQETLKQLQEVEATLNQTLICKEQLEAITDDLNKNNLELAKYKNLVSEQNKIMEEIENKYNKSQDNEESLKNELNIKAEHVTALENNKNMLEKQLQESESKMQMYENQLCTLKEEIIKLQENFGEFQNLNDLHELVDKENGNLVKAKQEFSKITEDINRKRMVLDQLDETLAEQEDLLKQRTQILEFLSEKEEEKNEIMNLNHEIEEKNSEINSLITNIQTRKKQISQLEKIILTLEDQNRKAALQKRKDDEIIDALEQKVAEFEYYIENRLNRGENLENLDNLIKILEDEMEAPYTSRLFGTEETYCNYRGTQTVDNYHNAVRHKHFNNGQHSIYQQNNENTPTKIVMGNFVKKTYNVPNDKYKSDLDRKQAITNINTQKWIEPPNNQALMTLNDKNLFYFNAEDQATQPTERYLKNLKYFLPSQSPIDKESKMSKLAAHRLS